MYCYPSVYMEDGELDWEATMMEAGGAGATKVGNEGFDLLIDPIYLSCNWGFGRKPENMDDDNMITHEKSLDFW